MSLEHSPSREGVATAGHRELDLQEPDRFVGEVECQRLTSLSRVTRWRLERAGQFPRRHQIAPNRIGWLLSEIKLWQRERAEAT